MRCPLDLSGEAFFQRRAGEGFPSSIRGPVGQSKEDDSYLIIDALTGLLSLVQMGVLEIHSWGCREDDLDRPDHQMFDLDPGTGIAWEHVVASGKFVRDYLKDLDLISFVKTSGGKWIHVVLPIRRRTPWQETKAFASPIGHDIVRIALRNFVTTMAKSRRTHRVLVDFFRNMRGSTTVAPYSTSARPGACVSTPLRWEELSVKHSPAHFTLNTVIRRLSRMKADPWKGYRGATNPSRSR